MGQDAQRFGVRSNGLLRFGHRRHSNVVIIEPERGCDLIALAGLLKRP